MFAPYLQRTSLTLFAALCVSGCSEATSDTQTSTHMVIAPKAPSAQEEGLHLHHGHDLVLAHSVVSPRSHTQQHITLGRPAHQMGALIQGLNEGANIELRTRGLDGVWSSWIPMEITWQEEGQAVGRYFVASPAMEVEFRGHEDLASMYVEYHDKVLADPNRLTINLPKAQVSPRTVLEDGTLVQKQRLAPRSLVIPRDEWGARNPGKICGGVVDPYRVSIHHTAQPDSDGGDPAARMRQMQAFHIDTRGWCDLGYHFVVSQSGNIYQGRSDETRPGAHVGNQNAGNIGVSFIGNYQVSTPGQVQIDAGKKILAWIHDTYPKIPWDRQSVRGHREWPGQTSTCPGSNLLALIPELMQDGGEPPKSDIGISISWNPAPANPYAQGSSAQIPDLFAGDKIQAEILLSNKTDGPLRGVKLRTMVEEPFLVATNYAIYSDSPANDQKTWMINDADGAPGNPAKDALGKLATLDMFALGAGETKRVLIDLEATEYSFGAIDHPDVRAWVQNIDEVYGEQNEWDQMPALNKANGLLQSFEQLDVMAKDQWQFDGGQETDFEGWRQCDTEASEQIKITQDGALALSSPNAQGCLEAPNWTSLDASQWDMVVLRTRGFDGPHILVMEWASEGETFTKEKRVAFELPGEGAFRDYVLDMKETSGWSGEITKLRIRPRVNADISAATPKDWYEFDAIFLQNAGEQTTNSTREDFVPTQPVTFVDESKIPDSPNNTNTNNGGGTNNTSPTNNTNTPTNTSGMNTGSSSDTLANRTLQVDDEGCSQTGSSSPTPPALMLLLLGLLGLRRRQR